MRDTDTPYFEPALRPSTGGNPTDPEPSLDNFLSYPGYDGQRSAQGEWVLTICDSYAAGDDGGQYHRRRLILRGDPVPINTRATWSYAVPNVAHSDNVVYTSTLFASDSAGNRSRYAPDGMRPASMSAAQSVTFFSLPDLRQLINGLIAPLRRIKVAIPRRAALMRVTSFHGRWAPWVRANQRR